MSDLIEILRLAKETVGSLIGRKRVVAEKAWDEVVLALDKLSELSNHHVKAVAEVTGPLLTDGNLLETSQRYTQLVNNPDFPQGYDEVRGILVATRSLPAFRGAAIQDHIRIVLDELSTFQYGVFTLSWDSYRVADAVAEAARVAACGEEPPLDSIARASEPSGTSPEYSRRGPSHASRNRRPRRTVWSRWFNGGLSRGNDMFNERCTAARASIPR